MIYGPSAQPRDVDIVVDGASVDDLALLFHDTLVRRTRFGGLHLNVMGWMVDIWPLSQTWALRELHVGSGDFEALTRTTFLNVEAVTVELSNRRSTSRSIYAAGFFEAVRTRTLDINLEENPFPELAAIRTLVIASRLRYGLRRRLARYVLHYITKTPVEKFLEIQLSHYGVVKYDVDTIHSWTKVIKEQIGTQPIILVPKKTQAQLSLWTEAPAISEIADRCGTSVASA